MNSSLTSGGACMDEVQQSALSTRRKQTYQRKREKNKIECRKMEN